MPIIEAVSSDVPLSQGDVLSEVKLFSTDAAGENAIASKARFCLVMSRPCGIAHKSLITVAAIDEFKFSLANKVESFDELLAVMTAMRDGIQSPDVFYLGHLPSFNERYCARLEQLHCLALPQGEQRCAFVSKHRIGRLNIDFCRDMHLRFFRAYASLGFDDHGWFATEDLKSLLQFADGDLSRAASKVDELKMQKARQGLQGKQFSEKELASAEKTHSDLTVKFAPYREELARRIDNPAT